MMIDDVTQIVLKYKKLIAEQRKVKETLIQQVANQRKVISNLDVKRNTYVEDQDKLYEKFQCTLSKDELNGIMMKKRGHTLS